MDWDELASLGIARGDPRFARPTGVALIVTRPEDVGVRGEWENELLGIGFRDRSANLGLPPVLAVGHRHARGSLEWSVLPNDGDGAAAAAVPDPRRSLEPTGTRGHP
jgi:hypothetical protein